jgi:hypothetical protein
LIARLAYPLWYATSAGVGWQRTLYVGVPQYGAHQAAMYLAAPDQILPWVGTYMPYLAGTFGGVLGFRWAVGRVDALKQVLASFPALYQLLPSVSGTWGHTYPLDATLFNAANYDPPNRFVKQKWMDRAGIVRTAIDATLTAPRPSERQVWGSAIDTESGAQRSSALGESRSYAKASGDGTVVSARAELPGVPGGLVLPGAMHADLLADTRLLARVTDLLLGDDSTTTTAGLPPPPAVPSVPFTTFTTIDPRPVPVGTQTYGDP